MVACKEAPNIDFTGFKIYLLNIGPPKQAENPIFGKFFRANEIFKIKSPMLFPQDKSERPNKESLMLLTFPIVDNIDITSEAQVDIIIIDPINEPNIAIS